MAQLPILKIYSTKERVAEELALDFIQYLKIATGKKERVAIALSGGSTPIFFFRAVVHLKPLIDWSRVQIYWVDERCVPPDHKESNYGVAAAEFLYPLNIPESSVFRMKGEEIPEKEAERYAKLIKDNLTTGEFSPVFDLVYLGIGGDGHTASIFPDQINLWDSRKLCTVGIHPDTGQRRVTFTGELINSASRIIFMVTGEEKKEVLHQIISKSDNCSEYPAALVNPRNGVLEWYLDEEAAGSFNEQ